MYQCGDKVKVVKLTQNKAMNLWGGYDDLSCLLEKDAVITSIINPDSGYEQYGLEFEDFQAQITRERTGYILSKSEIKLIN